jgi:hypothetical protein
MGNNITDDTTDRGKKNHANFPFLGLQRSDISIDLNFEEIANLEAISASEINLAAFSLCELHIKTKLQLLFRDYGKIYGVIVMQRNSISNEQGYHNISEALYLYVQGILNILKTQNNFEVVVNFGIDDKKKEESLKIYDDEYRMYGALSRISKMIDFANVMRPPTIIPSFEDNKASDLQSTSATMQI